MSKEETASAEVTESQRANDRAIDRMKRELVVADEARRTLAAELANHINVSVTSFEKRGSWPTLINMTKDALRKYRARKGSSVAAAGSDEALDRATDEADKARRQAAIYSASNDTLKARISKLESALLEAGIDPITVRDDEPAGFRDESHGQGGKAVAGAADELAAAFASSMTIKPERS